MSKCVTPLMVVVMIAGLMGFAWGQQQGQGGGQGGGQGAAQGAERGQRGGMVMLPPGAYVTVNEVSQELWQRIGELQVQLHTKTWELSLLHAQGAGEEQIREKIQELRTLHLEMRERGAQLREHVVIPERTGGGSGGGQTRGGGAR